MPDGDYTLDDIKDSVVKIFHRRGDPAMGTEMEFYLEMAFALGMGLRPKKWLAKVAELERKGYVLGRSDAGSTRHRIGV